VEIGNSWLVSRSQLTLVLFKYMWGSNLKRKPVHRFGLLSPRVAGETWHDWHARTGDDYSGEMKRNCPHLVRYQRDSVNHCTICGTVIN
jgi:hypothetical protein